MQPDRAGNSHNSNVQAMPDPYDDEVHRPDYSWLNLDKARWKLEQWTELAREMAEAADRTRETADHFQERADSALRKAWEVDRIIQAEEIRRGRK